MVIIVKETYYDFIYARERKRKLMLIYVHITSLYGLFSAKQPKSLINTVF